MVAAVQTGDLNTDASSTVSERLTNTQAALYALPWNAYAFVLLPIGVVLPTYYAESTLATMASIGIVSGLFRIFDAVTDPMIGYISDRTRTRFGARKPWTVIGALVACTGVFFLFRPPPDATISYYAVWSFTLYLGYTLYDIPHRAWGSELAVSYDDRSRIATFVSIFTVSGSLVFWLMPIILSRVTGTTEITKDVYDAIALLFIALLVPATAAAFVFVPREPKISIRQTNFREVFVSVRSNKPLWRYFTAHATWGVGQGIYLSVVFIFMRDYMGIGAQFATLMIVFFVVQFVTMPVWMKLMHRFGKHRIWALSWGLGVLIHPIILLVPPGPESFNIILALTSLTAFVNAASYIAPRAVLGDVIDYDILKRGTNNAGNFFAFSTFLDKGMFGIGVAVAFPFLALFNYQIGGPNDSFADMGLLICYLGFPMITHLTAAAILWNFPIDKRRHAIIRKRIEQRAERAALLEARA